MGEADHMDAELRRVLEGAYPGEEVRYFSPMSIGSAPEHADEGVTSHRGHESRLALPVIRLRRKPDYSSD
jgi:hypothetical protein